MAVLMSRTMEMANWVTTSTFRKEMLPLPALNKAFQHFGGLEGRQEEGGVETREDADDQGGKEEGNAG